MSARNFAQALAAGETMILPAGRLFYIRSASAALDITTEGNPGSPLRFVGIGAGAKFGPVAAGEGWTFLRVYSAAAQSVEVVISDDGDFDIASTVTIAGVPNIEILPSSSLLSAVPVAVATGTASSIGANASRRRISISANSANTGSLFVQAPGAGAGCGIELQPGMFVSIETTAAIDVRNDSGAAQTYTTMQEI